MSSPEPRDAATLLVNYDAHLLALPLTAVSIEAVVADRVAGVHMTQTWRNPYSRPLEAVYLFPLPGGAAVRDFSLTTAGRAVRGTIQERTRAQSDYVEAVRAGRSAALMQQEQADVFRVQVGNIPAGETVQVMVSWSERLDCYQGGTVELRVPLVVAPRYTAAGEQPPIAAPRLSTAPVRPLRIDVQLLEGARDPRCSHNLAIHDDGRTLRVTHEVRDAVLDRDFVLRWTAGGTDTAVEARAWLAPADTGTHVGMLTLWPPVDTSAAPPRDVVFLLDRSGSMAGEKLASATRAVGVLLDTLLPTDRFAVLAFDDRQEWLSGEDAPWHLADEAGRRRGLTGLGKLTARGGTHIDAALQAALTILKDPLGRQGNVVLLTDGQVSNDDEVLRLVQKQAHRVRLFTVGIDRAVNEAFLRRLASLGRGTASLVTPGENLERALAQIGRDIGLPSLTDLRLEDVDSGLEVGSVSPARIPDVFSGRPVTVFFRARQPGRIRIAGHRGHRPYTVEVVSQPGGPDALTHLWARSRAADLEDAFRGSAQPRRLQDELIDLSLRHGLLTRFTAFVAIDEQGPLQDVPPLQQVVAVPLPAGWSGAA